ncbi:unnamed protein product [Triticum turgidum subsp. durum]|uniref:TFIIS N-terminal domain-containing protein n=1 Tax=Triticum turgidum subsp. durum TaxID=4567 RepID=A0A9R0WKS4_TRITD|nr:unnamed protein product [Triticum turgidum subsp. durum]
MDADGRLRRALACDAPESPPQPPRQPAEAASPAWQEEGEEEEEEADVDGLGLEEETDEGGGLESKILAIKDFLEDPDQSEEELVSLLQNLADMDITYNVVQETDIGRHVNGLRKHPSGDVRQLVKLLVRKWKEIVDGWVRLHNSGGDGGNSILTDGDSPEKTQGKSYQNARVSDFKYTPSPPQRHSGSERPRNNNGFESTLERRRASPAPTYHTKQNNGNNYTTTSSSAPARAMREQKDNHLDEKLDSARKRLQENYQEAQNAKKQRTMQVLDIHDIPKPKNKNTFIRKPGGGGLPGRHR